MSQKHVHTLQKVKSEYDSTRIAIAHTIHYWHYQDNAPTQDVALLLQLRSISLKQFQSFLPEKTVEDIFITRLFALFEGILKEHHELRHPTDAVPAHASVSWYIDRVAFFNRMRISEKVVVNVHEVRKYRNSLVHSLPNITPVVFGRAISDLSKFVFKLPEN